MAEIVGLIAKVPESKDIAVYGRSDTTRGGGVMTRTRARFRWTTQVTRAARLMLDWPGVRARAHRGPLEGEKDALFFLGCSNTHKAPATIRLPTSAHPPFPFPPVSPPLCPPSVHPSSGSCLELATRRTADPVRPSHKGAQLALLGLYMTATGRLGRAGCLGRAKGSQLGAVTGHLFA